MTQKTQPKVIQIKYKTNREVLGEYLARHFRDMDWENLYNEHQKEYWYKEADKLMVYMKKVGIFG